MGTASAARRREVRAEPSLRQLHLEGMQPCSARGRLTCYRGDDAGRWMDVYLGADRSM
jgi:hypothetical protein